MKTLFRILATLSFFLFGGNSQHYALNEQDCTNTSVIKVLEISDQANLKHLQNSLNSNFHLPESGSDRHYDKLHTTDIEQEENELTSSKKYLDFNTHFITQLNRNTFGYFHRHVEKNLPNSNYFNFYPVSRRYILFEVFRI